MFEKVIEHVDVKIKTCPTCDATVNGKFPADMMAVLNYGNGLKTYLVNLLVCQMISLNRAQKLIKAMIGEVVAEATLLKFIFRVHRKRGLETIEEINMIARHPGTIIHGCWSSYL